MVIEGIEIETGIDKLVRLVKEKGRVALDDASKKIGISANEIQEWVNLLGDERAIIIEYKLKKPYLVERKRIEKESYGILIGAYKKFAEGIIKQTAADPLKAEIDSSAGALNKRLDAISSDKNEPLLQNTFSDF
ncbi:hypothetical protein HYY71_07260, partial [Candidatus Woesearchaeota archaeon]|nr:hypothetical protein [Candidatus Woesearchaeota archaeon]